MIKYLRVSIRAILFLLLTIYFIIVGVIMAFVLRKDAHAMVRLSQGWAKTLIRVMGVKIHYSGAAPDQNLLILPNHRSYIDIILILQRFPANFVAKAELKKWPVVSTGAKIVRTVFVDRKNPHSRQQTRREIKQRFEEEFSVVVFPEGTTARGPEVKPLKSGIFQVAAGGKIPVLPVAIEYQEQDDAWVDDDLFLPHFFRCFGRKHTHVKVRFGGIRINEDWKQLQAEHMEWLNNNLREMREEYDQSLVEA